VLSGRSSSTRTLARRASGIPYSVNLAEMVTVRGSRGLFVNLAFHQYANPMRIARSLLHRTEAFVLTSHAIRIRLPPVERLRAVAGCLPVFDTGRDCPAGAVAICVGAVAVNPIDLPPFIERQVSKRRFPTGQQLLAYP
jgi:hypothetical protein